MKMSVAEEVHYIIRLDQKYGSGLWDYRTLEDMAPERREAIRLRLVKLECEVDGKEKP